MDEKIYCSDFRKITSIYTEPFIKSKINQDIIVVAIMFTFVVLLVVAI